MSVGGDQGAGRHHRGRTCEPVTDSLQARHPRCNATNGEVDGENQSVLVFGVEGWSERPAPLRATPPAPTFRDFVTERGSSRRSCRSSLAEGSFGSRSPSRCLKNSTLRPSRNPCPSAP